MPVKRLAPTATLAFSSSIKCLPLSIYEYMKKYFFQKKLVVMNSRQNIGEISEFYRKNDYIS